jgi:hypothetical protein
MTATLLPNAKQQFLDGNGKPLAGGSVYFYIPNTSTLKSTWQDPAQTILNTNPVILDASGEATIWGAGTYRQVVYDAQGNLIWDQITEDTSAGIIGNMTDDVFKAGTDFTPGTTATLTLSTDPGSLPNTWIYFDGVYQTDDQVASLAFPALTFNSPIPVGVQEVTVKIGNTVAIGVPGNGTITDQKLSPTSVAYIITQNIWTLKRFGAKMDGVTDDTQKVLNAVNSGEKLIFADPGVCLISGTINMNVDGFRMVGAGKHQTTFMMANANLPALKVGDSLTGVELWNFTVDRNIAATSGGDGIQWLGSNSQGLLFNILCQNQWRGFALGPTDYSKALLCTAQQNFSFGFHVTNVGLGGPCQWSINQCLAQNNNSHGLFIDASTGTSGPMSLGEISEFSTFGNTGKGIIALGKASNPINGLRILSGFMGGDADDEIFLDTFGGQHKIIGVELELNGGSNTGRGNATPPTHLGHGISISANNERTQISDPNINGCSLSGIATFGSITSISNPHITNNGVAGTPSDQNGVLVGGGRVMIVGGYIADTGNLTQQFGVSGGSGTVTHITGTDLTGNMVAPTTGAGTIVASNCLP